MTALQNITHIFIRGASSVAFTSLTLVFAVCFRVDLHFNFNNLNFQFQIIKFNDGNGHSDIRHEQ